jgi:glycosyltransferase involved in cell wall biosynthesis
LQPVTSESDTSSLPTGRSDQTDTRATRSALSIVQIVPRIANTSSGPSVSVPSLCCSLQDAGLATRLFALEPKPSRLLFQDSVFFPTLNIPFAARLGVSPAMRQALVVAARESDIVHTNSLWMMPNIYPERAVRGTQCATVVSPRGTLSAWALNRARLRKWFVWHLGQKRMLQSADCLHATSSEELNQIRTQGFTNPVAVVPNGVHCPELPEQHSQTNRSHRTVLFLARIHPTKGVDLLLKAWQTIQSAFPDWNLKIAGPLGNEYSDQMVRLAEELQLQRVDFVGEVTGQTKAQTYFDSDLYVLPTHSENFGISVAEALAHGVPAIVFHGAPWSPLNEKQAGWWIAPGIDTLADTLRQAMTLNDDQRQQMGRNGHHWMRSEYDWQVIGRKMAQIYRWITAGGTMPGEVSTA